MFEQEIVMNVEKLPDHLKKEILDYTEFLLAKYQIRDKQERKLSFSWEGGLSDIKGEYTAVKLQHKARKWR
jgi:hypothetical protein